ncbi:glycosyltransferase [Clostridium sp. D33t1_170424_F3]|uniref:glycosyltransferase n=1 Tax=Clostridium sp. D33t1_170424_F3 TaxID=2787099 RepID=UPI0018AA134D|nr:glycosyltransferase [Clostridium sp. D33t1_170424_F3]
MSTILISAYGCEPDKGSEPGAGWHWAKQIAKKHTVFVLTRANNRESIEKELQKHPDPNLTFLYYDVPKRFTFWKRGQRGVQLYYILWQIGAYRVAKKFTAQTKVDIAIALTFGNMWLPTLMHKLPCRFIWGPIGGGEGIPKELWGHISKKQWLFEVMRRINPRVCITNPWFRSACKKAETLIMRTEDSRVCIPVKYQNKCRMMIETGVDIADCKQMSQQTPSLINKPSFVVVGRLISLKFVDIAVRAVAIVRQIHPDCMLKIVGDGEYKKNLEHLVHELQIEENVLFEGNVPRKVCLQHISDSLALLMTSGKEGGAWVLYEAMMCHKPIVCMDTSGMHMLVDPNGGIKIPVADYDTLVKAFADAMCKLIENPDLARKMGETGFKRVSTALLWDEKGRFFESLLQEKERKNESSDCS